MIRPDYREIYHYGMPRRSGRYPYGSGDRPYQSRLKSVGTGFKKAAKVSGKVALEVAKFSAKTAVNLAISAALGYVGGNLVRDILMPIEPTGLATLSQQIAYDAASRKARQVGVSATEAIAITTMIGSSALGNRKVKVVKNQKDE